MRTSMSEPETQTPGATAQGDLINTYRQLIHAQKRRISAHETAQQAEPGHQAEQPAQVFDLQCRMAAEIDLGWIAILGTKHG